MSNVGIFITSENNYIKTKKSNSINQTVGQRSLFLKHIFLQQLCASNVTYLRHDFGNTYEINNSPEQRNRNKTMKIAKYFFSKIQILYFYVSSTNLLCFDIIICQQQVSFTFSSSINIFEVPLGMPYKLFTASVFYKQKQLQ